MRYTYGGKNYYIAIPPPPPLFSKGRKMVSCGENLLYSHFPAYPGKGGKWLWRKMAL